MVDPFTTTILKLKGTGVFEFLLPFMITAAIFYGLLRKSQIFGEPERNVAVNAIVALVAGLMVWSYPIIGGVSFVEHFPAFFAQATSAMLVIMVGLLIGSMFFPPDLPKTLSDKFKGPRIWGVIIVFGILVGGGILVTSGMISLFFPEGVVAAIPEDILLTLGVVILLMVTIGAIVLIGGGEEKKGG